MSAYVMYGLAALFVSAGTWMSLRRNTKTYFYPGLCAGAMLAVWATVVLMSA